MEGPKEICCCPAYSWTKVIAWIQIIYYAIPTALLSLVFILFLSEPDVFRNGWAESAEAHDRFRMAEEDPYFKIIMKLHPMVVLLILMIILIPNIAMGVILLVGANKKSVKHLTIWTVYGAVCIVMQVCQLTLATPVYVVGSLMAISVYGFEIWVVQRFRREIDMGFYSSNGAHGNGRILSYQVDGMIGVGGGDFKLLDGQKPELNYNKV